VNLPPLADPILVTGATGFIGRRLVRTLLGAGHRPRALVLPSDAIPIEWGERVEVRRGDVTRRADVAAAVRDTATVFHLAAVVGDWAPSEAFQAVTVRGTEHVLGEAAARGARVVLVSSVTVYGDAIARAVCEEERPHGRAAGAYGRAKQEQERIAHRLEASLGLKVTVVRPTNVYGPASGPWVDTAVELLRRRAPALVGGGEQNAGLAYVDNVAELCIAAAATPVAIGRAYNACDGDDVSWRRYFTDLAALAGAPPPRSIPRFAAAAAAHVLERAYHVLGRRARPPITREALNLVGSDLRVPNERARRELGWAPRVSYAQGMQSVGEYLAVKRGGRA
jgi:nucleoside-diphosphate-sugar epimerase